MKLAELISANDIFPESDKRFQSKNKWDVIASCTQLFLTSKGMPKLVEHANDILVEREKSMSTGIGEGVAIPHATSDQIDQPLVAFFTFPSGIDFESVDGKPTFILVSMLVPKNQLQKQILALSAIARMGLNNKLKEEILKSSDPELIWSLIYESEKVK